MADNGRHRARVLFLADEGATATEYGILVGFLALALVVGAAVFALALNGALSSMGIVIGGWPTP